MPLICTYLCRPTATPLSPPPLRSSSACVTLISCLKSQKAVFFFLADRDVTKLVLWWWWLEGGRSGIGGLHCAVLWPRIGSGGFNSLISHFQTAAE